MFRKLLGLLYPEDVPKKYLIYFYFQCNKEASYTKFLCSYDTLQSARNDIERTVEYAEDLKQMSPENAIDIGAIECWICRSFNEYKYFNEIPMCKCTPNVFVIFEIDWDEYDIQTINEYRRQLIEYII